jgi:hypothetical protein
MPKRCASAGCHCKVGLKPLSQLCKRVSVAYAYQEVSPGSYPRATQSYGHATKAAVGSIHSTTAG